MGIAIPQVVTTDRATGAQVIDGSLKFDGGQSHYLSRTPSSAGNRKTWTWSGWFKRTKLGTVQGLFSAITTPGSNTDRFTAFINTNDKLYIIEDASGTNYWAVPTQVFRDVAWYHLVFAFDTTISTPTSDRVKVYVNGDEVTSFTLKETITENRDTFVNSTLNHYIGLENSSDYPSKYWDGHLSQLYLIDGQALEPSEFGFTDGLTNTWKPKKYTGTYGTNGFYLPMDGNSPIGQDQSGQGNNWTPVNFGGSVALDNPIVSGARPILNTLPGGTQAGVGVFGSKQNVGYAVTVYNDGGGNKYYIDGVKQDTVTGLIRGATYTFDTSDSTVSSHPFRFSATSNGSHGGGSEYTNGVAAITGAATTITVPHDAPNTLYYYCTSHSGMGADITGITTNEKLADQYASNCVLALPLVGANSDVSASIACTQTNYSITSNGNASASSDKSNFYNGSFEFDGNGDNLTFTTSSDLSLTGDFTIEFWINNDTITVDTQHPSPITMPTDGNAISQIYTQSTNDYYGLYKGGDIVTTGNNSALTNVWQHVAFTRSGSTCYAFLDGVLKNTATSTATFGGTSGTYRIGSYNGSGGDIDAYMQDLRIYNGIAKYTSNFVVPSRSPDILPDTPSGVAGGSKLAKITDGAVAFDGTGDELSVANSSDFDFGSGEFTIEAFFRTTNVSSQNGIVNVWGYSSNRRSWILQIDNSTAGPVEFVVSTDGTSGTNTLISGGSVALNKWHHVAAVRTSNTLKLFLDGIEVASTSFSGTIYSNSTDPLYIGSVFGATDYMVGQISNVRVIKGTALYTSRFTPPTEPLTNVTNTKLLCCQSNTLAGAADVSPSISGINDGIVWSEEATITPPSSGFNSGGGISQAFDGSTTTLASGAGSRDEFFVIDFSRDITVSTSLEVWMNSGASQFKVNDGSFSSSLNNGAWRSLSFTGTLSKLTVKGDSPQTFGNFAPRLSAIRIDGSVILTDPVTRNGDAAATNFNPFNTDINTVRGQESGYATMSPLFLPDGHTFTNGNLTVTHSTGAHQAICADFAMSSGKWYWEYVWNSGPSGNLTGIWKTNDYTLDKYIGGTSSSYGYYSADGNKYTNSSASSYGSSFTTGDVIGNAFDADNGTLTFYKNGISQGVAYSSIPVGINSSYFPAWSKDTGGTNTTTATTNFGQKPFKFPPPEGFQPLNTANVRPETVIARPDQYVGVMTYTGTSASTATVTSENIKFQPDFVWCKYRDGTEGHALYDSVRGGETLLRSNTTAADTPGANNLKTFIPGGFTTGNNGHVYYDGYDYVSWMWKAGGGTGITTSFWKDDVEYGSAAAAGLDGGAINPAGASVGTKQGFSIIYQHDLTVYADSESSHGLSQTPDFIISKNRRAAGQWDVYHSGLTSGKRIRLNQRTGQFTPNFSNTDSSIKSVSSTTFTFVPNSGGGNDIIHYIWHDVPGLQKFGIYDGNSSTDGPYVELGFRPALVMLKAYVAPSTSVTGWVIQDSERGSYNVINSKQLYANANYAEGKRGDGSATNPQRLDIDFLSNGFKLRDIGNEINATSYSYIYAAWAEAPTVDLYGGGANAR